MAEFKTPLKNWRVRRFKSIDEADIAFSPLTLVVGSNSSGKSSLLQSILVMAQAAQMRPRGDAFPLNGPFVELGEYPEVHSTFARPAQETIIGGTVNVASSLRPLLAREYRRWANAPADLFQTAEWELRFSGRDKGQPGSTHVSRFQLRVTTGRGPMDEEAGIYVEGKRRRPQDADVDMLFRGRWLRAAPPTELSSISFVTGREGIGKVRRRSAQPR